MCVCVGWTKVVVEGKLVAEVLVCLATDTTVYLSRRGRALKVIKLTFTIQVMVEGKMHPIRYSGLQFDGWKQRHW